MPELFAVLVTIALFGALGWIVGVILQVSDLLNSLLELSSAKDVPLRSGTENRRLFDSFGSIAGLAVIAVVLGLGVDLAGRLFFESNGLLWRLGFLVIAAVVLVVLVGVVAIVALRIRGDGLSYAVLRANLAEEAGERIKSEQVASFRAQLAQVDSRKRHIRFGLRDRAGLRPVRAKLAQVADEFAVVPPTGFGAVRAIRWKTANAYVWIGNPVRLIPSIFAAVICVDSVLAVALGGQVAWPWLVVPVIAVALSFMLALVQAKVALAAKAAWHAVYQKQRLDAVKLIEDLEKSSRKGVAGLGDRVARALQILRETQN